MDAANGSQITPPAEALLREWISTFGSMIQRKTFDTDRGHEEDFKTLFGICTQAVRFAEAYLVCEQAGFVREAQTLARASLEDAVTAQWCYFREGGMERLRVDQLHKSSAYYLAMADWLGDDELRVKARMIPVPPAEAKGMMKFTQVLGELDDLGFLRISYLNLSRATHVTDATVNEYLHHDHAGVFAVNLAPDFAFSFQGLFVSAAGALLGAALIADLTLDADWIAKLDQASDEILAPLILRGNLAEARRRDVSTMLPE